MWKDRESISCKKQTNKHNESDGNDEITIVCDAMYLVKHNCGMREVIATKDYNLFNAFFLFAPAVSFAVLLTAFVVVFVAVFPAMLASAVPKGDGWRSFCLSPPIVRESLLAAVGRVLDGDDLRGCMDCVVEVAFFVVVVVVAVVDEMVRVGVAVDSIDG